MKRVSLIVTGASAVALVATFLLGSCAMDYRKHNPATYARRRDWDGLKKAIEEHPSWVSRTDIEGRTALFYIDREDLAQLLLKNGADPNARDIYGYTPLHTVHVPAVTRLLLKAGADPNAQGYASKYAPLHCAVNFETLNSFINEETWLEDIPPEEDRFVFEDPDTTEEERRSRVKLLLEAGANVNIQARQNQTPLDIAELPLRPLLKQHGGKTVTDGWGKKHGLKPVPHGGFLDSLDQENDD